jgi:drug/metabolite transporter (DMT)-like permease
MMTGFVGLWTIVEALAAPMFGHISPYQIVWTRYGVHLLFMVAIWGWRDPGSLLRTRRPMYQLGRSLLMLCMPASWIIATQRGVEQGTLMTLFWLAPLLVLAMAHAFLREPVAIRYWIVAIVMFLGVCLIVGPFQITSISDLVFPLAMAGSFGLYVVMTRGLRDETVQANLFYSALGVFCCLTFLMPVIWVTPSMKEFAALVGVGLLGFGALLALDRAVTAAPLSASAPFLYVQIPLTMMFAMLLSQVTPGIRSICGLAFIAAAAVYHWSKQRVPATRTAGP